MQGFQPCVSSLSRHKHTECTQRRQREESEVEAGEDDAAGEAGVRNMSLEPATRDVSLKEEQQTQDKQPVVKEEVEEQPTRVPPIDKKSEGDPPASAHSSEIFV